jgi:hypothetical protein
MTTKVLRGEEAYRLRERGWSWCEVGRHLGLQVPRGADTMARQYAHRANKPWPPSRPASDPPEALAHRLRAEQGLPWAEVARRVGYASRLIALRAAEQYAQRAGLPWPIPLPDAAARLGWAGHRGRGAEAYRLRVAGHTWGAIAARLGYRGETAPMIVARDYARRRRLPWPVKRTPPDRPTTTPSADPDGAR